jgi:hypothetical protein
MDFQYTNGCCCLAEEDLVLSLPIGSPGARTAVGVIALAPRFLTRVVKLVLCLALYILLSCNKEEAKTKTPLNLRCSGVQATV